MTTTMFTESIAKIELFLLRKCVQEAGGHYNINLKEIGNENLQEQNACWSLIASPETETVRFYWL